MKEMNVTFYKDEEFFRRTYKGVRQSQIAETTEIVNCERCNHVHAIMRNCVGEVVCVATFGDEIVDMIVAAHRELGSRRDA